jgi:biotin carboxyl carrier protein
MAWYDSWLKNRMRSEIQELLKADGVSSETAAPVQTPNGLADQLPDLAEDHHDASNHVGRKSIVDDPYFDMMSSQVNFKHKMSRLTNRTLKEVSVRDWLVSAIIQCRVDTLLSFSRPEHKRFEMGFRVVKKDSKSPYSDEDRQEIAALEDFIYHCGRKDGTPQSDAMLFGEFLKLIARDALTFGHIAVEKVKTRSGGLHRFRPLPAESVYLVNKKLSRSQIEMQTKANQAAAKQTKSDNDPSKEQVVNEVPINYYKYVQVGYDMRPLANFGDEDLIFKLFNPQNFADSNGYCYSPLELAIINVTNHLNVENYNSNFFTHGYAARGILHLKGTVTQAQLMNFRRQFYNSISGQQHAWRTPIVAGLDEVQWVPMSASAREMEYINFNNHLLRIICAQFQIDPVELGLDYLISANGRAPMQQANNEYKIVYSRERGLKPILMFVEDMINCDLLPALDRSLADKYKFIFTGYTDETAQSEIAQMQAEMTVFKSMNDLLTQAQKDSLDTPAANLPLNQAFWALVEKNYTRGEIREIFFGDKGAKLRRELQYIPGDQMFMPWQQNLLAIDNAERQQKQQQELQEQQAQQQDMQSRHAEAKHQREAEKHQMEIEAIKAQAAANAVKHGNTLRESAKEFGASKASNVGGKVLANPINKMDEQE